MASIKCHPHLRAHAGKGEQYMQKIDGQDTVVGMGDYPNVSTEVQSANHNKHFLFMHKSGRVL